MDAQAEYLDYPAPFQHVFPQRHHWPPGRDLEKLPATPGQTFVVALEFLNQSAGNPIASGIEFDLDGCQANTNSTLPCLRAGPIPARRALPVILFLVFGRLSSAPFRSQVDTVCYSCRFRQQSLADAVE